MGRSHAADRGAEPFRSLVLRHRGRTGLTQRELAARAGASRRTVQDWELGVNYPTADRLQALILVFLEAGGLAVGHEIEEAEELWAAALREAPRMHTTLDRAWLGRVLAARSAPQPPEHAGHMVPPVPDPSAGDRGAVERRQDWGEAPDVVGFVNRADELTTLRVWILEEHCRLVAMLGMGGIGKTTLAARLAQDAAQSFQRVYWRGLRDALPTSEWLAGAIGFLSDHQVAPPENEAARLAVLLQVLRDRPSLLVLDNFDTLVEPAQREGRYREGYAGYGRLLQAIGEGRHQSCLVVTSRESPPELGVLSGGGTRMLQLGGLGVAEGQVLLAHKRLSGSPDEWSDLIARYGGNGLALKVVGERIRQVFNGDVGVFLEESDSGTVFGGIRRLLADQLERSSALEQAVLRVLAVEREPVTLTELLANLGARAGRGAVVEAVEALRRRSLVERAETAGRAAVRPLVGFTLQSVVLEYVTDRLVEEAADGIMRGQPVLLVDQPLIKAQAKDYVRQSQERLIGFPILQHLHAELASGGAAHGGLEQRLLALLEGWRNRPEAEQGYGPGNVVNLLRLLHGDLRRRNFAGLAIRQAYLAGVEAEDASLAGAHLSEAVLAEAFNFPICVALSGDGGFLVAGTAAGEIWLWRVADRTPLMAVQGRRGPVYAVALSADGQVLASGGEDGALRLWDAPSGQPLATLEGHTGPVYGVALSADGQLLASGGLDGTVRLWETPGGRLLATLRSHTGAVWTLSLSADGRVLASGGQDATVRLWSLADLRLGEQTMLGTTEAPGGRLLATLQGHSGAVWGVSLSADGRLLASGGIDGTVRLWSAADVPLGEQTVLGMSEGAAVQPLATLEGHSGPVWGVALSEDGRLLASSGPDGTVRLWSLADVRPGEETRLGTRASGVPPSAGLVQRLPGGRLLATLQGHTGGVRGVALSADGRLLASGSQDGTLRLWEASTGAHLNTLRSDRRYERVDITGLTGVTAAQRASLLALGAVDHRGQPTRA